MKMMKFIARTIEKSSDNYIAEMVSAILEKLVILVILKTMELMVAVLCAQ
jgi:hypothetical protein